LRERLWLMQSVLMSCLAQNCEPFGASQDYSTVAELPLAILNMNGFVNQRVVDSLRLDSRKYSVVGL
jgi:hypothetical protein